VEASLKGRAAAVVQVHFFFFVAPKDASSWRHEKKKDLFFYNIFPTFAKLYCVTRLTVPFHGTGRNLFLILI
jgi:hypothetical protein